MPQRMRRHRLVDDCAPARRLERACQHAVIVMMPAQHAVARIARTLPGWKHVLPTELAPGIGILAPQRMRQPGHAATLAQVGLVQQPRALDLALQRFGQTARQHRVPILAALAITYHDLVAGEVHVLHPQAQALHQAHPGAVQQTGDQPRPPLHACQQALYLARGEDRRQAPPASRAGDVFHPRQVDGQHLAVQEQQGRQGLILGAGRHLALNCQLRQKALDLHAAQLARVALCVRKDESPDPPQIDLLRAKAVVIEAQTATNFVHQSRRTTRRTLPGYPRMIGGIRHRPAPRGITTPRCAPPVPRPISQRPDRG